MSHENTTNTLVHQSKYIDSFMVTNITDWFNKKIRFGNRMLEEQCY